MQPEASGAVHLTDFGLAKPVSTGSKYTRSGEALGTPAYMSPEQARGEIAALSPCTDVWALGVVLYELVAGRPPFEGESAAIVVGRVLTATPRRVRTLQPGVPRALDAVIARAMARRPADRYANAAALRDDLDRLRSGVRPLAARAGRRRRVAVGLAAAVGIALAAVAWDRGDEGTSAGPGPAPVAPDAAAVRAWEGRFVDPGLAATALGAGPLDPVWTLRRGLLCWAAGRDTEARAAFAAVPARAPEHRQARLYLGLEAFFRLDSAALQERRDDLRALGEGADAAAGLARGAYAAAVSDWAGARAALRGREGWEAALLRGYVEGRAPDGSPAEAVQEFTQALETGLSFGWVFHLRAIARQRLGDLPGAEEDLTTYLRIEPGVLRALLNRGEVRRRRGDARGARADFEAALVVEPASPVARNGRGLARAALGDLTGGREDLEAAYRLAPDNLNILSNLANRRRADGDSAGALPLLTAALAVAPDDGELWSSRGWAHYDLRRHAEAIADFDTAIARGDRRASPFHGRGGSRQRAGDLAGAEADARAALALEPESAEGWALLGMVLQDRQDRPGAAEAFRQFLARAPRDRRAALVRQWLAANGFGEAESPGGR